MPDRPIQLILDASAIVAFVRESIDVGEVIAEVDAEQAAVGLPVLCLAQARTSGDDVDRLNLLAGHDAAIVLPDSDDWQALAATVELVGRWEAMVCRATRARLWTCRADRDSEPVRRLGRWGLDNRLCF